MHEGEEMLQGAKAICVCVCSTLLCLPETFLYGHILNMHIKFLEILGKRVEDPVWFSTSCATSLSHSLPICRMSGWIQKKKGERTCLGETDRTGFESWLPIAGKEVEPWFLYLKADFWWRLNIMYKRICVVYTGTSYLLKNGSDGYDNYYHYVCDWAHFS